jgi:hypothetical protein
MKTLPLTLFDRLYYALNLVAFIVLCSALVGGLYSLWIAS